MATRKKAPAKKKSAKKARKKKAPCQSEKKSNRDAKGRLLPGHNIPGPGSPQGTLDMMSIMRRKAKEHGLNLEDMVWGVMSSMSESAQSKKPDPSAARLFIDRVCGAMTQQHEVTSTAIVSPGPPVPEGAHLGQFVKRMHEVAEQQGLLEDGED
jgi:pyruvate/2-oxoglutarate dehydrogenase complex dihydrolipoamide acyltransferase (E2) component